MDKTLKAWNRLCGWLAGTPKELNENKDVQLVKQALERLDKIDAIDLSKLKNLRKMESEGWFMVHHLTLLQELIDTIKEVSNG